MLCHIVVPIFNLKDDELDYFRLIVFDLEESGEDINFDKLYVSFYTITILNVYGKIRTNTLKLLTNPNNLVYVHI